jgi:hypothetical protein
LSSSWNRASSNTGNLPRSRHGVVLLSIMRPLALRVGPEHLVDRYEVGGGGVSAGVGGNGHPDDRPARLVPDRRAAEARHDRLVTWIALQLEPPRALLAPDPSGRPHSVALTVGEAEHSEPVVPQLVDAPQRRHPGTGRDRPLQPQHGDVARAVGPDRRPPEHCRAERARRVLGALHDREVHPHPAVWRAVGAGVGSHGLGNHVCAGRDEVGPDQEAGADHLAGRAEHAHDRARLIVNRTITDHHVPHSAGLLQDNHGWTGDHDGGRRGHRPRSLASSGRASTHARSRTRS